MQNPITATLKGLLDRAAQHASVPALREDERLDSKRAIVTGANRGLGKAIAVDLAKRGADVLMACRSGLPAAEHEVRRLSGSQTIQGRSLDLGDLRSVVTFCETLGAERARVDLLVLNAGVVPQRARPTTQGFEEMFGVNYLANVLLVERLLAAKVLVPDAAAPPRIVMVSSETHRDVQAIDFTRLGRFTPYGPMGSMKVYGESKLLLNTYAAYLAHQFEGRMGVHSCCPGAVNTDIARDAPDWVKPILGRVMARFFRSPEAAAAPIVYLSCAHALEGKTGYYLHLMQEKPPSQVSLDQRVGAMLMRESEALIVRALGEPLRGAA
jgi:NAD(P)-dependent dehydrogenase (short-subunit alcohol dehydrogenase family)